MTHSEVSALFPLFLAFAFAMEESDVGDKAQSGAHVCADRAVQVRFLSRNPGSGNEITSGTPNTGVTSTRGSHSLVRKDPRSRRFRDP